MSRPSPIFSGSHVSRRTINLGGATRPEGTSQNDLIKRAKRQREEREEQRVRERAAAKIQAFCKGRFEAGKSRKILRARFDELLAVKQVEPAALLEASRLLALLSVDRNAGDVKRAAVWCRAVLGSAPGDKRPLLFSLYALSPASWSVLVRQISWILLSQASLHPSLPQAPLFLEITKMLCDLASYTKWKVISLRGKTPLQYLLARDLYPRLRALILSISPTNRTHPALNAAVSISLLPFKAFPTASPEQAAALSAFTVSILSIPLLPQRIPCPSLTSFANLPLEPLLLNASSSTPLLDGLSTEDAAHLLANVLAFGAPRVPSLASGKILAAYLDVLRILLNRLPPSLLAEKDDPEGKGKEVEVILLDGEDSDEEGSSDDEVVQRARERVGTSAPRHDADGDVQMDPTPSAPPPPLTLDPRTLASLAILPSRPHLISLLTLSTRFSASTRPALCAFLVSLLHSWHSKRDEVLNTIMYGPSSSTSAAGERGGGLLREIWRGYVRAGALGKLLGSGDKDHGGAVLNALGEAKLAMDWPALILLAELYSRCLLTLGDDEFHSTKNPLSLDEVIGLSGLLRNLAFALYWQEGALGVGTEKDERGVGGTRMGAVILRNLATTLLQQIHARDSRRAFTPPCHWLMTSQFDLASFIQTVVYEDEQLGSEGYEQPRPDAEEEQQHLRPLTKHQMAFVSPRLGVLDNIPFVIPFDTRVAMFRQFVENDRKRLGIERHRYDRARRHRAVVRRDHLAEDSFAQLNGLGPALKNTIEIVFVDEHGMEESGIDGGGLFKELLTSLSREIFDTDRGLWLATNEQELYPNPHAYARESRQLSWYQFIGRILGKALYEGILVDVRFAGFFLAKWLGRQSYLDDLSSLDPDLYKGLLVLKNYVGNVEEDLSLNFTVTEEDFGVSRTVDLIPGGSEIAVTNENRIQYIFLISRYRLNIQMERQSRAFFAGLSEIIPERFLRPFNQDELRILVGGADQAIDLEDLKANTVYGGWPLEEANETIVAFWSVVESFNKEERSKLVKFVTSCARPPLLGFRELNPRFAIRAAGKDETRLPTSSTCVNLLKLPEFSSPATLRSKLLYAINSGAGFDLS